MKINYKIVSGVLCAVLIYDGVVGFINHKRHNAALASIRKLKRAVNVQSEMMSYYATKMDEHNVPMDDYDVIATKTILEKLK